MSEGHPPSSKPYNFEYLFKYVKAKLRKKNSTKDIYTQMFCVWCLLRNINRVRLLLLLHVS
jgi:hypothetical protein